MIIKSKNFLLKLEEILKDELPQESYNATEKYVLEIIKKWHLGEKEFLHHTSGSTGKPQPVMINRAKIELSTRSTMDFIDPERIIKTSLLCLDPRHIGGAMVVYRALICNHNLMILEPDSTPLRSIPSQDRFDLVSLVPLQFDKMSIEEINRFNTILIGGAPVPQHDIQYEAEVYSTYGMTETVSHIALRKIDQEEFHTTGDTIVTTDPDQSLKIKGTITDNKWLKTNDLVEVTSGKTFRWIGRKDFIINSGGIKINPELVERKLKDQFEKDFIITSVPDEKLGRKVILLASEKVRDIDFQNLDKYEKPKSCFFDCEIFKTQSGKLDRIRTLTHFENCYEN